jgi:3-hydroxymyristoyl/3-hydroxydecanoyl-(acyl carrier protein) dehydratase
MTAEFEITLGEIEATERGARCVAHARVPSDLRYLEGHFPGNPIVPGVAQLVPLVYELARRAWPDLPSPTALKRLKFLEAIRPGDALQVHLEREGDRLRFEVRRGDTPCSHGTLVF